ncbi:hypothetical protein [Nitrosospira sp. Nsp2]|uniref:hypothetical protein n=1 Tax=Nitrosospira sp. Nsp2 TaxID=136548 RepID=UPI0011B27FBB|nr:hypothetical protein [Nitrosospira sp. Nsp2]
MDTLLIAGNQASGHGYSDLSGKGELCFGDAFTVENDLIGLSFNVGSNPFMNVRAEISSIDVSVFGGPFVKPGAVPTFKFTLFDDANGNDGLGSGKMLDVGQVSGIASSRDVFSWTEVTLPPSTIGNTDRNVTVRIDLLKVIMLRWTTSTLQLL